MKPELNELPDYLKDKSKINCIITDDQLIELKPIYGQVTASDIQKAIDSKSPTPVTYLICRYQMKPKAKNFKRVEKATDWDKLVKKQNSNVINFEEIDKTFKELEDDSAIK